MRLKFEIFCADSVFCEFGSDTDQPVIKMKLKLKLNYMQLCVS